MRDLLQLAAIIPFMFVAQPALAACVKAPDTDVYCQDCVIQQKIFLKQSDVCNFSFIGVVGSATTPSASLTRMRIVTRPKKGIYGVANPSSGAYKPNPGARGEDYFEFEIEFLTINARPAKSHHKISVVIE